MFDNERIVINERMENVLFVFIRIDGKNVTKVASFFLINQKKLHFFTINVKKAVKSVILSLFCVVFVKYFFSQVQKKVLCLLCVYFTKQLRVFQIRK